MGRKSFVAWLFVMALACLALSGNGWGWFVGGIVFLGVGIFALRQSNQEEETEREGASNSFIVSALLFMVVAMLFMFWFFSLA
jgi:hypothetical protein